MRPISDTALRMQLTDTRRLATCSLNAPIMVSLDNETDPLEVRATLVLLCPDSRVPTYSR